MTISLPTALFIVFLCLKLTHHVDWSWWWITAPLWIPASIAIAVVGIMAALMDESKKKKLKK